MYFLGATSGPNKVIRRWVEQMIGVSAINCSNLPPVTFLVYENGTGRHTQVVKGAVCKTAIRRFKSACRLQFFNFFRSRGE